jgi:hypothetical protein
MCIFTLLSIVISNEWEEAYFWQIAFIYLCCDTIHRFEWDSRDEGEAHLSRVETKMHFPIFAKMW